MAISIYTTQRSIYVLHVVQFKCVLLWCILTMHMRSCNHTHFMHYSSYAVLHMVRAGAYAAQAKTTFTHVNLLIEQKALKSSLGIKSEDCTKNSR